MNKREDGFYWVKYDGEWTIAEWWEITWCVLNDRSVACVDLDFEEIDERIIERVQS